MRKNIFYLNGRFVPEDKALISVYDLGLLRGYAVFDFLRTYNFKPFYLKEHLKRLLNSAKIIGLKHNYTIDNLEKIVIKTLSKNKHLKEAGIRIILTGGYSKDFITPSKPNLIVMITPIKSLPKSLYRYGASLITKIYERIDPRAKTIIYTDAVRFLEEAKGKGAIEVLLISKDNEVLECTTSNFFIAKENAVITPTTDKILEGITRKVVIDLCKKNNIKIIERKIYYEELKEATEAFITASNKEILPIVKIDKIKIGDGKVGQLTKFLIKKFQELTKTWS